ncbi:hypothetical protein DFJ74DRAFT_41584 [Hyaloraphidium curvatum]|nr:hypothetical protein DFJ74DRAFT_41584 [Hyaloraphidium curvatum]
MPWNGIRRQRMVSLGQARGRDETVTLAASGVVSYPPDLVETCEDARKALSFVISLVTEQVGEGDAETGVPKPLSIGELLSGTEEAAASAPEAEPDDESDPIEALAEQLPYQSGFPLPRIALSPLTRSLMATKEEVAKAQMKLDMSRLANPNLSSSSLRRLIEDLSIRKDKAEALERTIARMSQPDYTVESFDPDFLARQLAILEMELLRPLLVRCVSPESGARLGHVLLLQAIAPESELTGELTLLRDFHRYLVHVFISAILNSVPDRTSVPGNENVFTPAHARARTITHLLATSQILRRTYRCHGTAAAVMVAATSPEVRRLRSSWALIEPRAREYLERVRPAFSPNVDADAGHEEERWNGYAYEVEHELRTWYGTSREAGIVLVPWWTPVCESIRAIVHQYSTTPIGSWKASGDPLMDLELLALTEKGTRLLNHWIALVELSCGVYSGNQAGIEEVLGSLSAAGAAIAQQEAALGKGKQVAGRQRAVDALLPASLGGDEPFQHWLLTQPFYTRRELWLESIARESLMKKFTRGGDWFDGVYYPLQILAEDGVNVVDLSPLKSEITTTDGPPAAETVAEPGAMESVEGAEASEQGAGAPSDAEADEEDFVGDTFYGKVDGDEGGTGLEPDLSLPNVPTNDFSDSDDDADIGGEKDRFSAMPPPPDANPWSGEDEGPEEDEDGPRDGGPPEGRASVGSAESVEETEHTVHLTPRLVDQSAEDDGTAEDEAVPDEAEVDNADALSPEDEDELDRELRELDREYGGGVDEGYGAAESDLEGSDGEAQQESDGDAPPVDDDGDQNRSRDEEQDTEGGFATAAVTPGSESAAVSRMDSMVEITHDGAYAELATAPAEPHVDEEPTTPGMPGSFTLDDAGLDFLGSVSASRPVRRADSSNDDLAELDELSPHRAADAESEATDHEPEDLVKTHSAILAESQPWRDAIAREDAPLPTGPPPPLPPKPFGLQASYSPSLGSVPLPAPRLPQEDLITYSSTPPPSFSRPGLVPDAPPSAPDFEAPKDEEDEVADMLKDMGMGDAAPAAATEGEARFGNLWDRLAFLTPTQTQKP